MATPDVRDRPSRPVVADPVVELVDVVVPGRLAGVSLTVAEGEGVALVGPRGAGKSSTVMAVLGALEPAAGRVSVRGRVGVPVVALEAPDAVPEASVMNIAEVDVLIGDEPSLFAPEDTVAAMHGLLAAARSWLVATHDPVLRWRVADRAVSLRDGRVGRPYPTSVPPVCFRFAPSKRVRPPQCWEGTVVVDSPAGPLAVLHHSVHHRLDRWDGPAHVTVVEPSTWLTARERA